MDDHDKRESVRRAMSIGLAAVVLFATCSDPTGPVDGDPTGPVDGDPTDQPRPALPAALLFSADTVNLVAEDASSLSYAGTVVLSNTGQVAVGPVVLSGRAATSGDVSVPRIVPKASPSEIPTLNVGARATVSITVTVPAITLAGAYEAMLQAGAAEAGAVLGLRFDVPERAAAVDGTHVTVSAGSGSVRQGDVVRYAAQVRDSAGAVVEGADVAWSVTPAGGGMFDAEGRFVPYAAGEVEVVARTAVTKDGTVRMATAGMPVTVRPRGVHGSLRKVGEGRVGARHTSDLWVHGDYAYTGTWGTREGEVGNQLYAWTLDGQGMPTLSDSITVDARTVNDVKIRADGRLGVLTHEDGDATDGGRNGVTFFDLADPAHPRVVSRFSTGLEPGVHNAWLEGDHAYLVVDGVGSGLRILDISDPASPRVAASFYGGSSFLHDVYVRDGLAFLSHWDAGLIILDVGNGMADGSPANPVEVSRLPDLGGETHNVWYWPEAGYAFVGEEQFGHSKGPSGIMHVVDLSDILRPREVATYEVPGATSHNYWLDEEAGTLYLAWYEQGVRMLDVTGELMGRLERQGREAAFIRYAGEAEDCLWDPGATCAWAPQLHGNGKLYASDMNHGLVVLEPGR